MMTEKKKVRSEQYYFDTDGLFNIPLLSLKVKAGEAVALLGAKGTDTSTLYQSFSRAEPLKQQDVHCVTRNSNLFLPYSAYENFALAEKKALPYGKKQLRRACEEFKQRYGIDIDLTVPLKDLRISQRIMVDILRAYLADVKVYIFDNLVSLLEFAHRDIFLAIVNEWLAKGKRIVYLTTKWEHAVLVCSRIVAFTDNVVLGEVDTESVIKNPQHIIYLLSGRNLVERQEQPEDTTNLLNMLYTGAEYLTDNYQLNDALTLVNNNVKEVLHCDTSAIYLMDEGTAQLHCFASGPKAPRLTECFLRQRLQDAHRDAVFYTSADDIGFAGAFIEKHQAKTLLCMPIYSKDAVKGLLAVMFEELMVYDKQQLLYLRSFCKEIALILETSRLMGSSVLLQESNHRIKNNLQIIINLISMQQLYATQSGEKDVRDILSSIIGRVQNIASVHEILSEKRTGETAIDLRRLTKAVLRTFELGHISVRVDCDEILIPYAKATAISMVINELITNSVKYAFPGKREEKPEIMISCHREESAIAITVEDNGQGLPEGFDLQKTMSIGFSIIQTIVKIDLGGTLQIRDTGHGTKADIIIPLTSL